ncbi:MAG TPA: hypothetical protein VGK30_14695 [Candidatus Binatia bacterium]|jgi:hypothetical protein
MSIPVALEGLRAAIAERGCAAYLLTVSDDATPHAVHAAFRWEGDALVADVGKRTAANAEARSTVTLLFPLREAEDYSLIVDGSAAVTVAGDVRRVHVTPTRAVLHRPAAVPDPDASCGADCVTLLPSQRSRS